MLTMKSSERRLDTMLSNFPLDISVAVIPEIELRRRLLLKNDAEKMGFLSIQTDSPAFRVLQCL